MSEKILEAIDVTKIYGIRTENPVTALKDVSLKINKGDFVCIMGPSGSGKSTLIHAISTIDLPSKGKVIIYEKEIRQMSEREMGNFRYENLGFIFQDFNLLDALTVFENIAVPLTLKGFKQQEIKEKVDEVATKLGIEDLISKYPGECSGGQRQRVAICRALISKPKLIVADEPTGNLDSANSHELLSLFKELNDIEGVSIIMVTHDAAIASYSSKLLYLKDGKINATIERKTMSQKDYFYKIVEINSSDNLALFLENE